MVCFTQHKWIISKENAEHYRKLLDFFYPGVCVYEERDDGSLKVLTERFYDQMATIRTIPERKVAKPTSSDVKIEAEVEDKVVQEVLQMLKKRHGCSYDIRFRTEIDGVSAFNFYHYQSKIEAALPDFVTHVLHTPYATFFVIGGVSVMSFDADGKCGDDRLPIFDFEDGFMTDDDDATAQFFHDKFKQWVQAGRSVEPFLM